MLDNDPQAQDCQRYGCFEALSDLANAGWETSKEGHMLLAELHLERTTAFSAEAEGKAEHSAELLERQQAHEMVRSAFRACACFSLELCSLPVKSLFQYLTGSRHECGVLSC